MRIVVPGRALSMIGDGMLTVVLLLHLHDSGYGALAVTGLMVIEALPPAPTGGTDVECCTRTPSSGRFC